MERQIESMRYLLGVMGVPRVAQPITTTSSFPQFSRLPLELQDYIWELSIPMPAAHQAHVCRPIDSMPLPPEVTNPRGYGPSRNVQMILDDTESDRNLMLDTMANLLYVCSRSSAAVQRLHQRKFPTSSQTFQLGAYGQPTLLVNPTSDLVILPPGLIAPHGVLTVWEECLPKQFAVVQNIGVQLNIDSIFYQACYYPLLRRISSAPGLASISFIFGHGLLNSLDLDGSSLESSFSDDDGEEDEDAAESPLMNFIGSIESPSGPDASFNSTGMRLYEIPAEIVADSPTLSPFTKSIRQCLERIDKELRQTHPDRKRGVPKCRILTSVAEWGWQGDSSCRAGIDGGTAIDML